MNAPTTRRLDLTVPARSTLLRLLTAYRALDVRVRAHLDRGSRLYGDDEFDAAAAALPPLSGGCVELSPKSASIFISVIRARIRGDLGPVDLAPYDASWLRTLLVRLGAL